MNIRIGTDLVEIIRMEKSIQKDAFLKKVFHPIEIEYAQKKAQPAASFAARFAAKEAFFKALGTGLYTEGMGPLDVWIENNPSGRPELRMTAAVQALLNQKFAHYQCDVSLAHDGPCALATVVILFR